MLRKIYRKFRKNQSRDMKRLVKDLIRIENLKENAFSSDESLISNDTHEEDITVSLTTFGERIETVYLTLESLARQTIKPTNVWLWLSNTEFKGKPLPISLERLKVRGLEIKYCEDIKSYKKLIPTLRELKKGVVITIDDDVVYPENTIEKLIRAHQKYPESICCNIAKRITYSSNGDILPYNDWDVYVKESEPSDLLLPIGVGGVLYFEGCFDDKVLNFELFNELSPSADDLWFKVMAYLKGKSTYTTGLFKEDSLTYLDSTHFRPLSNSNIKNNGNNLQLKSLMEYFQINFRN